jgi:hypothetical protein
MSSVTQRSALAPTEGEIRSSYRDVRTRIQLGDILLYRGGSFVSHLIKDLTKGVYSHCGMATWWNNQNTVPRLMVFEAVWPVVAVRPASLSVDAYDGPVDWWSLKREYRKKLALDRLFEAALAKIGQPFAVGGLFRYLFWRLLGATGTADRECSDYFCSQYVSECFRAGNLDPVSSRADTFTSPVELARSGVWDYQATIHENGE